MYIFPLSGEDAISVFVYPGSLKFFHHSDTEKNTMDNGFSMEEVVIPKVFKVWWAFLCAACWSWIEGSSSIDVSWECDLSVHWPGRCSGVRWGTVFGRMAELMKGDAGKCGDSHNEDCNVEKTMVMKAMQTNGNWLLTVLWKRMHRCHCFIIVLNN